MALPPWAYEDLSKLLPEIRAAGEHHCHEFKAEFPAQAHELAKEVAAFATSGGGLVLIGVGDDGGVVGLSESDRDQLRLRAQGVVAQVRPRPLFDVTPCYDEGFILAILIRQDQAEPVYYYDHRPYIRDGSQSRPATPDEVKARVWTHPSAEHSRKMEVLQYEQAKSVVESQSKRTADWDELALKSAAAYQALMKKSN